jgi:hypothetical protein
MPNTAKQENSVPADSPGLRHHGTNHIRHSPEFGILAQLMRCAAYNLGKSEGIDLIYDKSVPFKNDRKLVKNLYAGLRFLAQQQFDALTSQVEGNRCNEETTG